MNKSKIKKPDSFVIKEDRTGGITKHNKGNIVNEREQFAVSLRQAKRQEVIS